MAQTTYRSNVAVTLQNRKAACDRAANLIKQLDALNLNLVSLSRDGQNFLILVLRDPLPASKVTQFDLTQV